MPIVLVCALLPSLVSAYNVNLRGSQARNRQGESSPNAIGIYLHPVFYTSTILEDTMRTHKIIDSIDVLTIDQLQALGINKGDAFCNLIDGSFDYALPQPWLDTFAAWCRGNTWHINVTYDLILSTTVWHYPAYPNTGGCYSKAVGPVTCCEEVYMAYKEYERVSCTN